MKRVAITLAVLGLLAAGAVYACPPGVSVGYSRNVGVAYSYVQPTVSIVSPYTPQVTLAAQYAPPVAAPSCACEAPQTAAPPAYEATPVAAPAVRYAPPSYTLAATNYSYTNVGVNRYVGVDTYAPPIITLNAGRTYTDVRVARYVPPARLGVRDVRVGAAKTRKGDEVTVTREAGKHRVGLRERIQVRQAAVRAARAAQ